MGAKDGANDGLKVGGEEGDLIINKIEYLNVETEVMSNTKLNNFKRFINLY